MMQRAKHSSPDPAKASDWSNPCGGLISGSQDEMASPDHESIYCFNQDPLAPDYNQGFASLDTPTQPLCSGQGPFLQVPAAQLDQEEQQQVVVASNDLPVSDMDLANFLEMDDQTLTELTGVNCAEWNSLFNGQLDDTLDPVTGAQSSIKADTTVLSTTSQPTTSQPPQVDRWLVEETQKLERQQKLQQQKLMELQQTLLKTEILKNQLQIATISQAQSPTMSTTASLLLEGLNSSMQQGTSSTQQLEASAAMLSSNYRPTTAFSPVEKPPPSPAKKSKSSPTSMTMSSSTTSRGGRMSTSSSAVSQFQDFTDSKSTMQSPPLSPFASDPNSPEEEPSKRKVHNLIEKKYRCSINDRICMLRDIVSKYSKDNKKLQKSAVLQKTIDFIHHLQSTIKKLQDDNQRLREALARATGRKPHLSSFSSPPNTPDRTPGSCDSEMDSGNPSSPDDSDGQTSPCDVKPSFFTQLLHNPLRHTSTSQYLMVFTLVAVFLFNPLALYGPGSVFPAVGHHSGSVRTLSEFEATKVDNGSSMSTAMWVGMWVIRMVVAAICFGWMTLRSMPRIMASSKDSVQFWRLRKQAEKDLQKGEYVSARSNLEIALSVINRPVPTSYLGMTSGLLWSFFSHVLFQLQIGRAAVYLATLFIRRKAEKDSPFDSPKKPVFGVTFDDVSETYHLLHQISMASSKSPQLLGMGYFLALNALNFAEADRPFDRLGEQKLAEMYFAMGLQCHYSMPYGSSVPMWYYFFCFRDTSPGKYVTPLKWAVSEPGKSFLMSGKWAPDVAIGSRLYTGKAALPAFSITRAYCKELLCETFGVLLLPDTSSDSKQVERDGNAALQAFKVVLNIVKEATACLVNEETGAEKNIDGAESGSDSGFTVIQWWASVGTVSCYWRSGKESLAEDYYSNIEALSGEMGAAVPSALQLAFKANRMYRRPSNKAIEVPALQVVLQLCSTTSNALEGSVANLMQDQSNSTETELHQLGLLQACDWLLSLKVALWEKYKQEERISQEICPGFYQDLDTLSRLVCLLPSARSRLHLYKGCYQLIAGASPIAAQAMLNSTGSASMVRRRTNSKEPTNTQLYSQEHVMAKVVAFKHLPPSMESHHSPFKGEFAPLTTPSSEQPHV